MSVRDGRMQPFIWLGTPALKHLRAQWGGEGAAADCPKVSTGLLIYQVLVEIANDDRARTKIASPRSEEFEAPRMDIARLAGAVDKTVDRALAELERIELVEVERRTHIAGAAGGFLPSRYTLVEPSEGPDSKSGEVPTPSLDVATERRDRPDSSTHVIDRGEEVRTTPLTPRGRGASSSSSRSSRAQRGSHRKRDRDALKDEHLEQQREVLRLIDSSERATTAWASVCVNLRESLGADRFALWIEPLELLGVREDELCLWAPDRIGEWITRRFLGKLRELAAEQGIPDVRVFVGDDLDVIKPAKEAA